MFPSIITKNSKLEILTKNLVIFERWDGVRMKNLIIMRFHWKIQFLGGVCLEGGGGGVNEKVIYRGELPKKGMGLDSLQI